MIPVAISGILLFDASNRTGVSHPVKVRIIDIALQAGVSTATVDRVLNNRPGVRQKTVQQVMDAAKWLEASAARPRIFRARRTEQVIDIVIAGGAGFANDNLAREVRKVCARSGAEVRAAFPRRMNPVALAAELDRCAAAGSAGVIVQPLDHPAVREAVRRLCEREIPVVAILTDLPRSGILGYVGLDNLAAGRTAGQLIGRLCRRSGPVLLFKGSSLYRSHEERLAGFGQILRNAFPELSILGGNDGNDDPKLYYEMTRQTLLDEPNLCAVCNLGGGNRGIEKALLESGRDQDITYVAFNLTPLTRQGLVGGVFDAVVHQDMVLAADMSVRALLDASAGDAPDFCRVPVEIMMSENLEPQRGLI